MHGLIRATHHRRQRASARRHFRNGWRARRVRAAVLRAFTGAELYLDKRFTTLARRRKPAARREVPAAALILIKDGDEMIRKSGPGRAAAFARGCEPGASAAQGGAHYPRRSSDGLERWTPEQRAEFGRVAGVAEIWDCAISPVINEERVAAE